MPSYTLTMSDSFDEQSNAQRTSLAQEVWLWMRDSGKWYLLPILLACAVVGGLMWLSSSWAAPFIYPLF